MSSKTKIIVLHMKELIYTGIFAALGILLMLLLIFTFLPGKDNDKDSAPSPSDEENTAVSASAILYIPGIYSTELVLGSHSVDVEVIVDSTAITSIRLVDVSESVTTMYPLLQPTLDSLCEQIFETQSLEDVTYAADSKYTSLVLLEAIRNSLDKALVENTPAD